MALNKFMHPRNIYRNPPDFAKMAIKYPEFSAIVTKDVTGKVSVNFKDPQCLRVLTKYLLKSDFNLNVEIPEDRLVPTLPLRINYILWIEDLLNSIKRHNNVLGIDIGTGACAIYPLLAAVTNKWHMVATDTDTDSLSKARVNIETNNLQELITLIQNETSSVIQHLLSIKDGQTYDFCMCNPPFYSNMEELCESRSIARPPPKNAFTGSPQELITNGGELEFIRNLIMESRSYKTKILIYTTMVGHKYNLKELLQDLKDEGIQHTHTEFCQGRVTRWGVAWTYQHYNLNKLVPPRNKDRKKRVPISFAIPMSQSAATNFDIAVTNLKSIFNELNISYHVINKRGTSYTFNILATENTWSNQRRKRRLEKRLDPAGIKKVKQEVNSPNKSEEDNKEKGESHNSECSANKKEEGPPTNGNSLADGEQGDSHKSESKENLTVSLVSQEMEDVTNFSNIVTTSASSSSTDKVQDPNRKLAKSQPIVQAFTKIFKKESTFFVEMEFLSGLGGKESLHQIAQYVKNKWQC